MSGAADDGGIGDDKGRGDGTAESGTWPVCEIGFVTDESGSAEPMGVVDV